MSLQSVIKRFATGTYTVTRSMPDIYVNGIRTPGTTSTFDIIASIQPVTGEDLKALPEGRRAEDTIMLWTTTELLIIPNPDKINVRGEVFEVIQTDLYSILSPPGFYKVLCTRQVIP